MRRFSYIALALALLAGTSVLKGASPASAILLDPGHGGHDAGLIAPDGRREKDLALILARDLSEKLSQALPGVKVILTRPGDTALTQEARAELVSRERPALLLSLHFGAAGDTAVNARPVFYPAVTAPGKNGGSLLQPAEQAGNLYASQSWRLADCLCRRLSALPDGRCHKPQAESLTALTGLTAPAAVAEIGYLSHPAQLQALGDRNHPAYAALLAALAEGIRDFLENPGN